MSKSQVSIASSRRVIDGRFYRNNAALFATFKVVQPMHIDSHVDEEPSHVLIERLPEFAAIPYNPPKSLAH